MNITVVGGGNIGTQFAVHCAEKGHDVTMFTSVPDHFSKSLSIVDPSGNTIHEGDICMATSDPHKAFRDTDMILITMPPTMMIALSELIYDNTDEHTIIGFVPGNGGFELAFRRCIERGNTFFGIDRVPAIARLTERGKTVCCSGYKDKLYVGALPAEQTEYCSAFIESIFEIPCVRLPGFMALTLTPSNPILHTSRLKVIFQDYEPGVTYDSLPLFYEEWDDESSALLLACDDEIQEICRALPDFGLEHVISERKFYNADTVEEMTLAITSEESLLGLTTPSVRAEAGDVRDRGLIGIRTKRKQRNERIAAHMKRISRWRDTHGEKLRSYYEATEGMDHAERRRYLISRIKTKHSENIDIQDLLIPDLHSRYFTADFPYGLAVIQQIGQIAGVSTPNIDGLIEWYDGIAIINDRIELSDYGITDMDSLRSFYLQ